MRGNPGLSGGFPIIRPPIKPTYCVPIVLIYFLAIAFEKFSPLTLLSIFRK